MLAEREMHGKDRGIDARRPFATRLIAVDMCADRLRVSSSSHTANLSVSAPRSLQGL